MVRNRALRLLLIVCIASSLVASCTSCSPVYVLRAAFEEGKILANREEIDSVLKESSTTEQEKLKLQIVKDSREFAISLGLTPGKSFTKYTRIDKDVLTWVVVASRADSFSLHTWWFPIAGTMPYKGFFDKEDAEAEAAHLKQEEYETWVRGSEAFSTLGWFNDPVLTPTLKQPEARIANTVIHESVHATVWIKDNVAFNESLANFVGMEGAVQFFTKQCEQCTESDLTCKTNCAKLLENATRAQSTERLIARTVEALFDDLKALYKGSEPKDEKLNKRQVIFAKHIEPLRALFPTMTILEKINNAEIIQLILYMTHLDSFDKVYAKCDRKWDIFLGKMRDIAKDVDQNGSDPFTLLDSYR